MNQLIWDKSRLVLLKFCTFAFAATLLYIFTKTDKEPFADLAVLEQWDSIKTNLIKFYDDDVRGKQQIDRSNHNLKTEVFLMPSFDGNIYRLIKSYLKFDLQPKDITVVEDKQVGSYGLFERDNTAYLSTCIHPQGKTVFNGQQLTELVNKNLRGRTISWIFGLSDFRDWRCFWVSMSVELKDISDREATTLLQNELHSIVSKNKFQ